MTTVFFFEQLHMAGGDTIFTTLETLSLKSYMIPTPVTAFVIPHQRLTKIPRAIRELKQILTPKQPNVNILKPKTLKKVKFPIIR